MSFAVEFVKLEIFTEAYLRGLVNGAREEPISNEQKEIMNAQLQCDYEKWVQNGQDLTPVIMHHRASVDEITITINDVFEQVEKLELSNTNPHLIGVQLDFAMCCLRRTIVSESEEWDRIQEIVDSINSKYVEICNKIDNLASTSRNTRIVSMYQTPLSGYYTTSSTGSQVYYVPQYHPQMSPYFIPQYQIPQQFPTNSSRVPVIQNRNSGPATSSSTRNNTNTVQSSYQNNQSDYAVVGPHEGSHNWMSKLAAKYQPVKIIRNRVVRSIKNVVPELNDLLRMSYEDSDE
ncbi:unnamed protein product [Chironomus riparius]|uniref:Uncharacterized protein n=1 Tax=Chironomus riparius TaxID=315576 RepID=A0A9N9WM88_9DIPT|nr:unnamed protein product [Chironomus riparius]